MSLDAATLEWSLVSSSLDSLQHPQHVTLGICIIIPQISAETFTPSILTNPKQKCQSIPAELCVPCAGKSMWHTWLLHRHSKLCLLCFELMCPFICHMSTEKLPFPFVLKITIIPNFSVHISYSALEKADPHFSYWCRGVWCHLRFFSTFKLSPQS